MSGIRRASLIVVVLVVTVVVLTTMLPRKDICSDAIRGYKDRAAATVDVIRSGYASIRGELGTESILEVPQIANLTALDFSVLRACDTHCRLLSECMRLRVLLFKPPSESCPQEYHDLKETQRRTEDVLERLAKISKQIEDAQAQTPAVKSAHDDVKELEKTGGATGSRLAQAEARQRALDEKLNASLRLASTELSSLLDQQRSVR